MRRISFQTFNEVVTSVIDKPFTLATITEIKQALGIDKNRLFIFRNHTEPLAEHIFLPLVYGKFEIPTIIKFFDRELGGSTIIPHEIHICSNCRLPALHIMNKYTSLMEVKGLNTNNIDTFIKNFHTVLTKLYCTQVIKKSVHTDYKIVKNVSDLFFTFDGTYHETYRWFYENQILFLHEGKLKRLGMPSIHKFDIDKPFLMWENNKQVKDFEIFTASYMLMKQSKFFHPTIHPERTFMGQHHRRVFSLLRHNKHVGL